MDDLVQFLRDRLVEDDAVALAASWDEWDGSHWIAYHREKYDGRWAIIDRADEGVITTVDPQASADAPVARHIARHDPARVLAEVEAKRRIMRIHNTPVVVSPEMASLGLREGESPEDDRRCVGCGLNTMDQPLTADVNECPILRALALPYANHSNYRDTWRL